MSIRGYLNILKCMGYFKRNILASQKNPVLIMNVLQYKMHKRTKANVAKAENEYGVC